MSMDPQTTPEMDDAAGRDEAAEGLGDLYEPPAESSAGADSSAGEDQSRAVPADAAGSGSGDSTATAGDVPGGTTGGDMSRPLG